MGKKWPTLEKNLGLYCRIFYKYQDLIAEYLEEYPGLIIFSRIFLKNTGLNCRKFDQKFRQLGPS